MVGAGKASLCARDCNMALKICMKPKGRSTVLTTEWLLAQVNQIYMPLRITITSEDLSTGGAHKLRRHLHHLLSLGHLPSLAKKFHFVIIVHLGQLLHPMTFLLAMVSATSSSSLQLRT